MPRNMCTHGLVRISQADSSASSRCWLAASRLNSPPTAASAGGPVGQRGEASGKALDFVPVGVLGLGLRVGGPLRQPHDEADHVAVEGVVALVVEIAPEN